MPTVAELIIDALARAGVPRIFGARTGVDLDLAAAARRAGLAVIPCHHESSACLMAAVTGELMGRPGAALTGPGAGVTASMSGLAHAWLDRSPMIYLTEVAPGEIGGQRLDQAGLLEPVVKGSVTIAADSAAHWVAHAVQLASKEPRGPVHLEVPAGLAASPAVPLVTNVVPPAAPSVDAAALARAAAMIVEAKRPIVVAGLQCRPSDAKWLRAFCEALPTPMLSTRKSKGVVPDPHPLSMGTLTGGAFDEPLLRRADLVMAFGVDPVELIPGRWPSTAPVLSLARAPAGTAVAGFSPALELVADLGSILEDLAPRLVGRYHADWDIAEVDRLRRDRHRALDVSVGGLAPHRVVQIAREMTPAGTIASVDAAPGIAATVCWQAVEPGEFVTSSGLDPLGFALPAAAAAQLVHPDRRVLCFTDRAGLMAVAAELETVARLELPIVIVALVDDPPSPDGPAGPAELARAFGIAASAAEDEGSFRAALYPALAGSRPAVVEARVDPAGHRRLREIFGGVGGPAGMAHRQSMIRGI